MNANKIKELIQNRHSNDTVVPECKIGMTGTGCLRFDVWVMCNSWANAECIGYEIKVNRSDFLNDTKYRGYLNYCNTFYFVCPSGLIDKDELEDGIGLLWVSKTGNILYKKKKAKFRDIQIPEDIFRYVLMARSKIVDNNNFYLYENKKKYFQKWLEDKQINYELGHKISKSLNKRIEEEILNVKNENNRLKKEIEKYRETKEFLDNNNLNNCSAWSTIQGIKNKLEEIKTGFSYEFRRDLNKCIESLNFLKQNMDKSKDNI